MSMFLHSEMERYRATIQLRTPEGESVTAIILRRGQGRDGRVWFVFDGALKTTLVMDDDEAAEGDWQDHSSGRVWNHGTVILVLSQRFSRVSA